MGIDPHWYCIAFHDDGDYIEYISMAPNGAFRVHARWLIPGTELED